MWNREFSDQLQQDAPIKVSVRSSQQGTALALRDVEPGFSASDVVTLKQSDSVVATQDIKPSQVQRNGPGEKLNFQMRGSFVQTLVSNGVKVVDRNVIMRTSSVGSRTDKDTQEIETSAFLKHAKILMEILNTADTNSPNGWATFVSVKRIEDGLVLLEGYMDGKITEGFEKPLPKFEADPRGGFREVSAKGSDFGSRIAKQTLSLLEQAVLR